AGARCGPGCKSERGVCGVRLSNGAPTQFAQLGLREPLEGGVSGMEKTELQRARGSWRLRVQLLEGQGYSGAGGFAGGGGGNDPRGRAAGDTAAARSAGIG